MYINSYIEMREKDVSIEMAYLYVAAAQPIGRYIENLLHHF